MSTALRPGNGGSGHPPPPVSERRELLAVAFPLILSTGSWSIQHFIDRMFLAWYSPEALAAAMPAGILNYTIASLFIGTAAYVSTFVAQYLGGGEKQRIGSVMWQGVYISIFGGIVLLALIPAAGTIFGWAGHGEKVRAYETVYFRILCLGGFPAIGSAALSGFFSGLGKTCPVMWANILATAVNVILDGLLIFGYAGFPRMGIAGAAIATNISATVSFVVFFLVMTRRKNDLVYGTRRNRALDPALFWRILRFGLPSGVQSFIDIAGFAAFIFVVGRLGTEALAATNIAFNINTLAFMPMLGLGIAVSVLVGRNLGADDPAAAERVAWTGFRLTLLYMGTAASLYVLVPGLFIAPYAAWSDPAAFAPVRRIAVVLLRFVALYSLFDAMNIVFASAVKGAGDTRFVMFMILGLSVFGLIIPSWIALSVFHADVFTLWAVAAAYVCMLGICFFARFLGGKWKSMRVIEIPPRALAPVHFETPGAEFEM